MELLTNNYREYSLFSEDLNTLPKTKIIVNTINQYSYCIAEEDKDFKNALVSSDILLPDGVGIVYALKATTGKRIKKISGADLHQHLLEKLDTEGGKCFYMGASVSTLNKIKERLNTEFPNIKCEFYSPPFKTCFTEEENNEMIKKINSFNPDVLFIGMTAPKQEKWAHDNKNKVNATIICSIGAVFDFYAGTVARPSKFWIDLGLEWFVRLCKEPKRMWRRYLYYGPVFIYGIVSSVLKIDVSNHKVTEDKSIKRA